MNEHTDSKINIFAIQRYGKSQILHILQNFRLLRKAYPQHWNDISFGFSNAHIALTVNSPSEQMACEIYIPDSKKLFSALFEKKETIENELSEELEWEELPEKKASGIKLVSKGSLSNQESWGQCHLWMLDRVSKFQKVFGKYI